jgi:hypothetical protein
MELEYIIYVRLLDDWGVKAISISYDGEYTNVFHSPGIEPRITGCLKNIGRRKRALDAGCSLVRLVLKIVTT